MPVIDLAVRYRGLSDEALRLANEKANPMGIEFSAIMIENISLPDEWR